MKALRSGLAAFVFVLVMMWIMAVLIMAIYTSVGLISADPLDFQTLFEAVAAKFPVSEVMIISLSVALLGGGYIFVRGLFAPR